LQLIVEWIQQEDEMIPASYFFKSAYSRAWLDTPAATHLGKALVEMREASSATQQDVAALAKVSEKTISKIEGADDVLLSSIVRYMRSIGGGVELVLKTSDGQAKRIDFSPEVSAKRCA
jgi:DNA-binding transcriptional regulator YiaG